MTQADAEPVVVGRLSGVYGVKGWHRVYSFTQPRDKILQYSAWQLQVDGKWQSQAVEAGRQHGAGVLVKLAGCDDRDTARTMIGRMIAVAPTQLESLRPGEYYWAQLIGLAVESIDGEPLGVVTGLMETGANDVLVTDAGCLIPFAVPQIIKAVELEPGKITADWTRDYN